MRFSRPEPFSGKDGDEIDHDGLWITSGLAEWWALTMDERKQLVEVTIDEARKVKPSAFIQACTVALSPKDTVELTLHAQEAGADICYLQNPVMEAHGGPGMFDFFKYVADRTDIALGMFNSPSSGYTMSAAEVARVANEIPAMCSIKDASEKGGNGMIVGNLAPGKLVYWVVFAGPASYFAGWVQLGWQSPCTLGGTNYLSETPSHKATGGWLGLVLEGKLEEAREKWRTESSGASVGGALAYTYTQVAERPNYWTHWGSGFKYCAQLLGLPVGDYPHSRPPQLRLTEEQKARIKAVYVASGLIAG
jgi:4-hydroxy-tetrahydrodipicolinate synthase